MMWNETEWIKTDDRMGRVTIEGVEFPMCLTIKATDAIEKRFQGVDKVNSLLSEYAEKNQYSALMKTTLELALLLIDGGLNRCRTRAKMRGEEIELPTLPSMEDLQEVMTFEDLLDIQQNIFAAYTVGSARNVEARPDNSPKNAESATS